MTLEKFTAKINANIFLREFSFAKNQFSLPSRQEVELADHVIWIGNSMILYQLKERDNQTEPTKESEMKWFDNKVIKKGVKQIRDTLNYINGKDDVFVENQRGLKLRINNNGDIDFHKVILYLSQNNMIEQNDILRFYESSKAGFIHLIAFEDYIDILNTLITPSEILEYLIFRQSLLSFWNKKSYIPSERALLGQFIFGDDNDMPSEDYLIYVDKLKDDKDESDMKFLMNNFSEKITFNKTTDYYYILNELALLNRKDLSYFKQRFSLSIADSESEDIEIPYIMHIPRTNCSFVFVPVPKAFKDISLNALNNLTLAGKYVNKAEKCIGISFFRDGEYYEINWCFMEYKWEYDKEIEDKLQKNHPFRPASEKISQRYNYE